MSLRSPTIVFAVKGEGGQKYSASPIGGQDLGMASQKSGCKESRMSLRSPTIVFAVKGEGGQKYSASPIGRQGLGLASREQRFDCALRAKGFEGSF